MESLEFDADVIEWRGPAPFVYARLPAGPAGAVSRVKRQATYGWGVIPVEATIGGVTFTTSLFPREGTYLLPLKDALRRRAGITVGDTVSVVMHVGRPPREPDL